jgi:hypothetical protein
MAPPASAVERAQRDYFKAVHREDDMSKPIPRYLATK